MDDETLIATLNSIPLHIDVSNITFDERGWDWAVNKGFDDLSKGSDPTALCGLQIGINKAFRGNGLSRLLIEKMRTITATRNFTRLILPVRPILKHLYPLIDMEDYLQWKTTDGLCYDPWIRAHVKYGAEIVTVCPRSMYVSGSIREWEEWTGLSIQTSGQYVFNGGLCPLTVDRDKDIAEYTEPNVWVMHRM